MEFELPSHLSFLPSVKIKQARALRKYYPPAAAFKSKEEALFAERFADNRRRNQQLDNLRLNIPTKAKEELADKLEKTQ